MKIHFDNIFRRTKRRKIYEIYDRIVSIKCYFCVRGATGICDCKIYSSKAKKSKLKAIKLSTKQLKIGGLDEL